MDVNSVHPWVGLDGKISAFMGCFGLGLSKL